MQIVRLYDEVALMNFLQDHTVKMIHATTIINAIKKLITAHEIISLNLTIEERFKDEYDNPPWDISALSDLNQIRREILIYHKPDFHPTTLVDRYNSKMTSLFNQIKIRKKLLAI